MLRAAGPATPSLSPGSCPPSPPAPARHALPRGAAAPGGHLGGRGRGARRRAFPLPRSAEVGAGRWGRLRLFLDTAEESEWEHYLPLGFFHGVTTNPVLLQRAGVPCSVAALAKMRTKALAYPGVREVMFQAWGDSADALVSVAGQLLELDSLALEAIEAKGESAPLFSGSVVVKLPLTRDGMQAAARLRRRHPQARVCMTTCYSAQQALVASGLGAEYIAPYLGRMSDLGMDGIEECARMHAALGGPPAPATRVLVASIRSVDQMMALACRGLDTFTFSPAVAQELLGVAATEGAAAEFERAAQAGRPDAPRPEGGA